MTTTVGLWPAPPPLCPDRVAAWSHGAPSLGVPRLVDSIAYIALGLSGREKGGNVTGRGLQKLTLEAAVIAVCDSGVRGWPDARAW